MANKNKRKKSGTRSAGAVQNQTAKAQTAKVQSDKRKRWMTIAIVVLAALMALSILLPSLSAIFAGGQQDAQQAQAQSATDAATTQAAATSGMAAVDSEYGALVKDLEAKLKDDPENLAAILNLGNDYMGWASAASAYATDDTGSSHVKELYVDAITYFDKYLELEDSKDVRVRRALCQYYKGDTDDAIKALDSFTQKDGADYGLAWAYLGIMYRSSGDADKAEAALNKAIEVDENDDYGAKTLANQQLASMKSGGTTSGQSLAGALSNSTTSGN